MPANIQRVLVFPKLQRITHWLIAGGVIFQLLSAWLVQNANVDVLAWSDWHTMIGQALTLPLLLRLALFFIAGPTYWRAFIPSKGQYQLLQDTLKFYASLGRRPCPDWHSYNPVWQPLYLLMIALLILTTVSGLAFGLGPDIASWHGSLAALVLYFTLAHLFFSVLHDVKGNGAQISAMLNGYKYFQSREATTKISAEKSVSIDSLLKK